MPRAETAPCLVRSLPKYWSEAFTDGDALAGEWDRWVAKNVALATRSPFSAALINPALQTISVAESRAKS